jgi:hypothetical protein
LFKRVAALVECGKPKVHSKGFSVDLPDFGDYLRDVF